MLKRSPVFSKIMDKVEKIRKINEVVERFFDDPGNPRRIAAKDLMPLFIRKGIFTTDHRNGLPIRSLLRELDQRKALSLIPYVFADRKNSNVNWYFTALNSRRLRPVSVSDSLKVPTPSSKVPPILDGTNKMRQRQNSDEYYVIGLCNEVLGQTASQQHRFEFLRGDTGRKLPVDAYYEQLNLVVEYCETQHTEAAPFFDRRMTVSGVSRGEQRRIYDQRRRDELSRHQIHLVEIHYSDFGSSKRLKRDRMHDIEVVKRKLSQFIG